MATTERMRQRRTQNTAVEQRNEDMTRPETQTKIGYKDPRVTERKDDYIHAKCGDQVCTCISESVHARLVAAVCESRVVLHNVHHAGISV